MDAKQLRHRKRHARGMEVCTGASKRRYWVNPETSLLHLVRGTGRRAKHAADPGVHPDDAAEFLRASSNYVKADKPKAPPPPPPSRQPAPPAPPGGKALAEGEDDPGTYTSRLPAGHNDRTVKGWVELAAEAGIPLTVAEAATKPKAALVDLIRTKAAVLDARR